MKAIINGKIIVEKEVLDNRILLYSDKIMGFIESKAAGELLQNCQEIVDAKGNYVSPGFIDMHIHGSGGYDIMDGTEESLATISSIVAKNGVTGILATTMTMNREKIYTALDNIKHFMGKEAQGAKILGVHLEGPFINRKYKGAQADEFIIEPDFSFIEKYVDIIKVMTLAPEMDENYKFIKEVKEKTKIILSMGHSNAEYEQAVKAIENGVSHATHTFNAMSPLNHRNPGVVGAVLNSDIYCELIADKIHVHPAIFNILATIKGMDKVILITDSMRAGCLHDGISELGGQKVIIKNNTARLEDGTLAGSTLRLNHAIKNFMDYTGNGICQVVKLASLNPAKELGIEKDRGSLEVGKYSDIVILDEEFNILKTIVEGKTVYTY
ncbi:N-acetylglucosamine-6-phosphate deacetylase [Ruminiclostridium papyrosolvens]|uniref:N-acetylglucosamine-6-phosphate deacetylase n=1 Tax=Ruminiclostridium papyrosolvens C7 TaxID=1330534 RepID=U4QZD5_9FIRM|nr:N-acetylglucosamine-6-phosphate deacetylase [Ruminiclostridium papyrosolvens]EPR10347.1 N-acetylglucosamine-6-phosphate deacetylase [Ruminiclostridium papyrosolvens C7]